MAKKTTKKVTKKTAVKKSAPKKTTPKKTAKKAVKKTAAKKAVKKVAKKTVKKPAAKKTVKKAPAKKTVKKAPTKKAVKKKKTVAKSPAKKIVKKAAAKKSPAKKTSGKTGDAARKKLALKKASVERSEAVGDDTKAAPTSFSLDEVEAVIAARKSQETEEAEPKATTKAPAAKKAPAKKKTVDLDAVPVEKRVHEAASLADILGFNPSQKKKTVSEEAAAIPRKWKKYYKLLVELRQHLQDELDLHTSDTLMHSAREDAGDLSNYGNHQADAGTDTFDRDFALSVVSSEQDALYEIEQAIQRMLDGSYGVCEQTGEPIKKERLEAVPFARFSLEGQKEFEKNNRRKNDRVVEELFSDSSDAPKIMSDDD